MNLQQYLEEYKALTLAMIDEVKKNGQLNSLIEKRDDILKSISNLNFDKEEIRTIGKSLKLLELEQELNSSVKKEMVSIKRQIETIKKTKQANTKYNSFENKARVFNRSI